MTPDSIHRDMLAALPELGPHFRMDEVLGCFAMMVWESHAAGNHDVVRRSFDYVESLFDDDPELATLAAMEVFKNWGSDVGPEVGARTRDAAEP